MSNWFKQGQPEGMAPNYDDLDRMDAEAQGAATRYRLVFPIDVFFVSTGNPEQDQEIIYEEVKNALSRGFSQSSLEGYSDYLNLSDVKTHDQVMKEEGF